MQRNLPDRLLSRRHLLKGVTAAGFTVASDSLPFLPQQVAADDSATLRDLGRQAGVRFGVTVNGADPWYEPGYMQRISEFAVMAPIGGAVTDDVLKNWNKFKPWAANFNMTMRLYNLFWSQDVPPGLMDGAPDKPFNASQEYKDKILQSMRDRIRFAYTNFPEASEIIVVNEAYYEKNGVTGFFDSPYYRAFGGDWPAIAYIETYRIGVQEFGRNPGQDVTFYIGDFNFQMANAKAKHIYENMKRLIQRASSELGVSNLPIGTDMQFYVDYINNPPQGGTMSVSDINAGGLGTALQMFGEFGKVSYGEVGLKGGSRDDRTAMINLIVEAALDSKGICESILFWNPMRRNGPWGNGDLLFDANSNYDPTPTLVTLESTLQQGK